MSRVLEPSECDLAARRDSALAQLVGRINYEHWQSPPYNQRDFKLDRMRWLLRRLGDPQHDLKIVHIAGTKGKGSTAAMIGSTLTAAGYQTGMFTSPHLERLEERMTVDGSQVTAAELIALFETLWPVVAEMDHQTVSDGEGPGRPTYFEITTALALLHFARKTVDAAILEVGLGGRLDSTNVCDPLVSVITSISLDHTQQLGDTLAAIAREKAGIIKPGVPVISGVTDEEPGNVIRQIAESQDSRLVQLGVDFDFDYHSPKSASRVPGPYQGASMRVDYRQADPLPESTSSRELISAPTKLTSEARDSLRRLEVGLLGHHQAQNAAVAVATILELVRQGWSVSEDAIRKGLSSVAIRGRVEQVGARPTVIVDTAHNVASVRALVATLEDSFEARPKTLLFACPCDKDTEGMLQILLPAFDRIVLTRYHSNPRALPLDELTAIVQRNSTSQPECFEQPGEAWDHIRQTTGEDELICVTGSFFLAAEVRPLVVIKGERRNEDI